MQRGRTIRRLLAAIAALFVAAACVRVFMPSSTAKSVVLVALWVLAGFVLGLLWRASLERDARLDERDDLVDELRRR